MDVSKNPPNTAQFCEGVQTSPHSEFTCGRAYIKETYWSPSWTLPEKFIKMTEFDGIFHCIPLPTFTPKTMMLAGGRKEKFINGPRPPD